jgi:hypothetical protein
MAGFSLDAVRHAEIRRALADTSRNSAERHLVPAE